MNRYVENRVFASLANGDIVVYFRDPTSNIWNSYIIHLFTIIKNSCSCRWNVEYQWSSMRNDREYRDARDTNALHQQQPLVCLSEHGQDPQRQCSLCPGIKKKSINLKTNYKPLIRLWKGPICCELWFSTLRFVHVEQRIRRLGGDARFRRHPALSRSHSRMYLRR